MSGNPLRVKVHVIISIKTVCDPRETMCNPVQLFLACWLSSAGCSTNYMYMYMYIVHTCYIHVHVHVHVCTMSYSNIQCIQCTCISSLKVQCVGHVQVIHVHVHVHVSFILVQAFWFCSLSLPFILTFILTLLHYLSSPPPLIPFFIPPSLLLLILSAVLGSADSEVHTHRGQGR